ncbi:hypothetical protein CLV85_1380 [Salinibacterium amurskyense]|uniref:Very-short-patch-repair endonuclease n=1 Tax=Salinibacterium amurskyense TaxID=205941 RepID=A0A2M9D900_9MICO|nr:type IV toxin-antitoxin system AbiEi family antitoxin domain-containing protein [Salinibacterium amurskyense]PJJ82189.1 hypothetical protein CLV85_1380 [Salinibacterium amurskyense]
MMDVRELVDELGGLAQKQQLVARGVRDCDLTRAVRRGEVVRARQGWYSTAAESEPRLRAVRVGGRLTGVSAIADWGGWVLGDQPLHVSVVQNAARLRSPRNRRRPLSNHSGVRVHWDPAEVNDQGTNWHVSVFDALKRTILDESLETAVAAVDWALHTGRIDGFDFERLILALPLGKRKIRSWIDARCESLPESLARTRLRLHGHRVEIQIPVGLKRIDLVVNGIVGLEIDGRQFHAHTFEEDHLKAIEITIAGFHAMSISARMVFTQWELFLQGLDSAMAFHSQSGFGNSGDPTFSEIRRQRKREF